jgi:hypothetical protein
MLKRSSVSGSQSSGRGVHVSAPMFKSKSEELEKEVLTISKQQMVVSMVMQV